jgi:hypothetical protein
LFITAALIVSARLVQIGNLDAQALADKVAAADPVSALDWPELRILAVVPHPDGHQQVLLHVGWPAHARRAATLLVALDSDDHRSLSVLSQWRIRQASVSPVRREGAGLELRRRRSLERVHAVLIAEDATHISFG